MIGNMIGQYEIEAELGQGGIGIVYLASDTLVKGRQVAIKVLRPEQLGNESIIARFKREAEVIAKLEHPSIVPIYAFGETEEGSDYIVMPYMKGRSLGELIEENAPYPLDEAIRILEPIAAGLDVAHEEGIIHRDIKPQNILFDRSGNAYLTDFGVAKMVDYTSTLTIGEQFGTPAYMSPEQFTTGLLTPQSDIFSLGLTLIVLLTGRIYSATNALYSLPVIVENPDIPDAIEPVLAKVLAINPEDRYETATAFIQALKEKMLELDTGELSRPTAPVLKQPRRIDWPTISRWGIAGLALILVNFLAIWGYNNWFASPTSANCQFEFRQGNRAEIFTSGSGSWETGSITPQEFPITWDFQNAASCDTISKYVFFYTPRDLGTNAFHVEIAQTSAPLQQQRETGDLRIQTIIKVAPLQEAPGDYAFKSEWNLLYAPVDDPTAEPRIVGILVVYWDLEVK